MLEKIKQIIAEETPVTVKILGRESGLMGKLKKLLSKIRSRPDAAATVEMPGAR